MSRAYFDKVRTIYGLRRPGTVHIRYVGQTYQTFAKRINGHVTKPHTKSMANWIEELSRDGIRPEAIPLGTATGPWQAMEVERDWIASMSVVFGPLLLNEFHRGDFIPVSALERSAKSLKRYQLRQARRARHANRRQSREHHQLRRLKRMPMFNGVRKPIAEWAREIGISRERMRQRVEKCVANGVCISEALTTPANETMPSFVHRVKRKAS